MHLSHGAKSLEFLSKPEAKALARLCICADSPQPLLLDNTINTKVSCAC